MARRTMKMRKAMRSRDVVPSATLFLAQTLRKCYFDITTSLRSLAPVQRRDEAHLIAVLQLILELAFELPIRVIDEDEDPRPSTSGREAKRRQHEVFHPASTHSRALTLPPPQHQRTTPRAPQSSGYGSTAPGSACPPAWPPPYPLPLHSLLRLLQEWLRLAAVASSWSRSQGLRGPVERFVASCCVVGRGGARCPRCQSRMR